MRLAKKVLLAAAMCMAGLGTLGAVSGAAWAQNKPTIKLGYVQSWPSSSVTTKLAANVIENKLHYKVNLVAVSAGPMYQAISTGDLDAMLTAWLPVTHKAYYKKIWPKVLNLGPNLMGTKLGLAVPSYVNVNSIKELSQHASKFDNRIVGVGAGAGINEDTEQAIKQYGLKNFHLQKSSTAAMAATLKRAMREKKWVVVTAWSPLWIWGKFDLKYLKDPKHIYGQAGYVATLASRKLPKKAPAVYEFLRRFQIKLADLNNMEAKANASSEKQAVSQWVKSHPKIVNSWIAGVNTGSSSG